MRIAVVGCGYWGAKHVRVLSAIAGVDEVVAVDTDPRMARLADPSRRIRHSVDLDATLDAVDGVVIATPPRSHAELAARAVSHGCHVLVEKPLARSVEEAAELVQLARAAGVLLMCGHTFEYNPAVWALREAVAGGQLGRVHFMDSVRLNLGPVRRDVDVIADLATHDISIANYVLGSRPDRVAAWAGFHTHREIADTATVNLHYDALDVSASVRVSWLDPVKVRRTTVVGDRLMAVFDDLDPQARLTLYDRGIFDPGDGSPVRERSGATVMPALHAGEPLALECEDFIRSIQLGVTSGCDGWRGLDVVRVVAAAQQAATSGRPVEIDWPVEAINGAALSGLGGRDAGVSAVR